MGLKMVHGFMTSSCTHAAAHSVAKMMALRGAQCRASAITPRTAMTTLHVARTFASLRASQKRPTATAASSSSSTTTTASTRKAASADTKSHQKGVNPFQGAPANSVVAYVGPYMRSLQSGKSVAFVFGACGCMAVPATLYLGNTEHLLAAVAGVLSVTPSILLHSLTRHDVFKISVQGSASKTTPSAIRVADDSNSIQMSIEQLNWRGKPKIASVSSKDLVVDEAKSKGNAVVWKLPGSIGRREEKFRIDKAMLMNNPSFAFVLDQIEEQTKQKKDQANADNQD